MGVELRNLHFKQVSQVSCCRWLEGPLLGISGKQPFLRLYCVYKSPGDLVSLHRILIQRSGCSLNSVSNKFPGGADDAGSMTTLRSPRLSVVHLGAS